VNPQTTEAESIGVLARTGTWTIDPVHSTIAFRVRDMRQNATIRGRFTDYEDTLEAGPEPRVRVAIQAVGLTTDSEDRDRHLRSADFLDVAEHPAIPLVSDTIVEGDDGRIHMTGSSDIESVRQPLELEGTVLGSGTDRYGNDRVAIEAQGDLRFGTMPVALVADISFVPEGSKS
jgi:polyisoprenoid-binding protein YceI